MPENDDVQFGGSVDRSKLEEMKAAAGDDPVRQAQVAEVQAQVDAVAESDAAAEKAREEAVAAQHSEQPESAPEGTQGPSEGSETEAQPRASTSMSKSELVDLAESYGLGSRDDLEVQTRPELIDKINNA